MEPADLTLEDYLNYVFRGKALSTQINVAELFNPVFPPRDRSHLERLHITWTTGHHIANGLHSIHRNDYIHRDLKPSNGMNLRR